MPRAILAIAVALPLAAQNPAFLHPPTEPTKRIEFLQAKPTGPGPWPLLVLIHGHQDGDRPGAAVYKTQGTLQRFAQRGIVAVAVSQPGYGQSDGPPDFAGPRTHNAIAAVIHHMQNQPYVLRNRVGLYGYSRGAIAAAMVATQLPHLQALILGAGMYDLHDGYRRLNRSVPELDGLAKNLEHEAGTTPQSFRERSALPLAHQIKAATLILHGAKDDRCPVAGAEALTAKLRQTGTHVELRVFPDAGHGIPPAEREKPMDDFIDRWLLAP